MPERLHAAIFPLIAPWPPCSSHPSKAGALGCDWGKGSLLWHACGPSLISVCVAQAPLRPLSLADAFAGCSQDSLLRMQPLVQVEASSSSFHPWGVQSSPLHQPSLLDSLPSHSGFLLCSCPFFIFLTETPGRQDLSSLNRDLPCPLQWKLGVFTTGLSGNSSWSPFEKRQARSLLRSTQHWQSSHILACQHGSTVLPSPCCCCSLRSSQPFICGRLLLKGRYQSPSSRRTCLAL